MAATWPCAGAEIEAAHQGGGILAAEPASGSTIAPPLSAAQPATSSISIPPSVEVLPATPARKSESTAALNSRAISAEPPPALHRMAVMDTEDHRQQRQRRIRRRRDMIPAGLTAFYQSAPAAQGPTSRRASTASGGVSTGSPQDRMPASAGTGPSRPVRRVHSAALTCRTLRANSSSSGGLSSGSCR